jgi:tetratricopeptide (TPR) repeat protein
VGESKCEITVETDKGTVRVVRGPKVNNWEVKANGRPPLVFEKVGVKIVPEAARVVGLNIVRLGDADIPVNIMDQLESHFMLASLGGQDASGSLRAQVIDEISGLSGIEGVIKDVSLDNHRFGREARETEEKMEETRKQLHDEAVLQLEGETLSKAEKCLADSEEYEQASMRADELVSEAGIVSDNLAQAQQSLDQIPDTEKAKKALDVANEKLVRSAEASDLFDKIAAVDNDRYTVECRLVEIPDVEAVIDFVSSSKGALDKLKSMTLFLSQYEHVSKDTKSLKARLEKVEKAGDPSLPIQKADLALASKAKALELLAEARELHKKTKDVEQRISVRSEALKKVEKEVADLMASIKVCPLTMAPISKECSVKGEAR